MKGRKSFSILIILTSLLIMICVSCDFSLYEGNAKIVIDLGDPGGTGGAAEGSRFILPQDLSTSDIISVVVSISGPDINKTSTTYTKTQRYIYTYVPAGKERTIGLELNINPTNEIAVLAFGGETTISLKPGDYQWVHIKMAPTKMKLLAPDWQLQKLYQYENINDATRETASAVSLNLGGSFRPYDVDVDASGRIYVADSLNNVILRFDKVTSDSAENFRDIGTPIALTIDKYNDMSYYASANTLYKGDINLRGSTQLNMSGIDSINGMYIHSDGMLYIVGIDEATSDPALFIYDPNFDNAPDDPGKVIAQYNSAHFVDLWDVVVKGSYIYMTNLGGANNWKIIRINTNLTGIIGFGQAAGVINITNDYFYGPRKFISKVNDLLTIIDDSSDFDKIISINDVTASAWKTIPNVDDSGQGLFNFYQGV